MTDNELSQALGQISLRREDGESVLLGELWENEIAVLAFLRHFG